MTTSPKWSRAVIGAVYHLQRWDGRRAVWPTAKEIADHLELPLADVLAALRYMRGQRIMRDRRRRGSIVWMPWSEAT